MIRYLHDTQPTVATVVYYVSLQLSVFWVSWSLCLISATLCLFLSFNVNHAVYLCLCGRCDALCMALCTRVAQIKLQRCM